MKTNTTKSMIDLAKELGISRATISDLVRIKGYPTEPMQHGRAKGLSPAIQRRLKKDLGLTIRRHAASA